MSRYDDPEYMLRRVITHTVHARTLIHAAARHFIGNNEQRIEEARELIEESIGLLKKVLDKTG